MGSGSVAFVFSASAILSHTSDVTIGLKTTCRDCFFSGFQLPIFRLFCHKVLLFASATFSQSGKYVVYTTPLSSQTMNKSPNLVVPWLNVVVIFYFIFTASKREKNKTHLPNTPSE